MPEPEFLTETRDSYDTIAATYTEWICGELDIRPVDRAMLRAFAEIVATTANTRIADIGCGPGRVTSYLTNLGADVFGIDLSSGMIEQARAAYPTLSFEVGSMLDLPFDDHTLGGIVAWYSIIHVPDELLPQVFSEFHRTLASGGYLLLGFQVGDQVSHRDDAAGHPVSLDFRYRQVDAVAALLNESGFDVRTRLTREPDEHPDFPERSPQGFVIARSTGSAA
jgi:SAM-dependent methyltransferase